MQAYFGERGCVFDQASAILDSNSEEAWRETKMRPREWELGCSSQYGGELTTASCKTKTPALQASRKNDMLLYPQFSCSFFVLYLFAVV